jgi:hypothetical protein
MPTVLDEPGLQPGHDFLQARSLDAVRLSLAFHEVAYHGNAVIV